MTTVSETLNKAADLIETRGWEQGEGWGTAGALSPLCMEGGIIVAAGLIPGEITGEGLLATCPAAAAVADYLELGTGRRLWEWNDGWVGEAGHLFVRRTAAEVIEVLRAAAVIEESREAQAIIAAANALDAPVVVTR